MPLSLKTKGIIVLVNQWNERFMWGTGWSTITLAGKRDSRCYCTMSFNKNVVVVEPSYQMLFRDFIILFLGEGLTFFNKDNSANFPAEKKN